MIQQTLLTVTTCIAVLVLTGCQIEKVSDGLYRGPYVNKKRLVELKKLGIKTIVNVRLNPHKDSEKMAKEMGIKWAHIPSGVFIAPREKEWDQFLAIIEDPKNQPVYLTCTIGADRTGFYVALYRLAVQHWQRNEAVAELQNGFSPWWRAWYAFYYYPKELKNWELLQSSVSRSDIIPNERTAKGLFKLKPGVDLDTKRLSVDVD
ncbi:MAG: tyrosine-protein phosphatase [Candidatus Obscuribacterales bacterium]|nr:tyrosine-protein phosphatase [Candidatus Obscuribacterales bacterium]